MLDIALRESRTVIGKLTWTWKNGNPVWDKSGTYPVLSTCLTKKGRYRWDRSMGTYVLRVRQDRSVTGSQLRSYFADGGQQLKAAGVLTTFDAQATRERAGRYRVDVRWRIAGSDKVSSQVVTI